MKKSIIGKLRNWKESKRGKPLILRGARQVGKTWILKEFGKVDFIIQTNNNIYPVEAKTGTNVKSSSAKAYLAKYDNTKLCIRFSLKNFSYDGKILNIPLYLIDKTDEILELINK